MLSLYARFAIIASEKEKRGDEGFVISYVLLGLSLSLETAKNVLSNQFSITKLKSQTDIYKFGFYMYLASFVVALVFPNSSVSWYTVALAAGFAVLLGANQFFFMKALSCGPMSFTNFIQCTSLVIPALCGVLFWQEKASVFQLLWLIVLIISLFLALKADNINKNPKWWMSTIAAMIAMGGIGVLQSVHQMSAYKEELTGFLKLAFLFTALIYLLLWRISGRKEPSGFKMGGAAIFQAVSSGGFMSCVHIINLYLAGVMPKIIFFPATNGGLIILTLLCAVVIFRERLTAKQWAGLILSTIALCGIGLC